MGLIIIFSRSGEILRKKKQICQQTVYFENLNFTSKYFFPISFSRVCACEDAMRVPSLMIEYWNFSIWFTVIDCLILPQVLSHSEWFFDFSTGVLPQWLIFNITTGFMPQWLIDWYYHRCYATVINCFILQQVLCHSD